MGNFARKIKRNQLKMALKKQGEKRKAPLSQYRFKTEEERLKEQTDKIVEQMARTAKKH